MSLSCVYFIHATVRDTGLVGRFFQRRVRYVVNFAEPKAQSEAIDRLHWSMRSEGVRVVSVEHVIAISPGETAWVIHG